LIPVSGLKAGKNAPSAKIAKLVVNSTTLKEFGVRGISNNVVDSTGTAWRVAGKNTGKEIGVGLSLIHISEPTRRCVKSRLPSSVGKK
ncbi:hypothetical protein V3C21_24720, partial [Salmonella enterica subsp. enterica serovar Paratyphi B]